MKLLARLLTALVFGVIIAACATHEAIRENRKKRRLGTAYEGPAQE